MIENTPGSQNPHESDPAHLAQAMATFGDELRELLEHEEASQESNSIAHPDPTAIDPFEQLLQRYGNRLNDDSSLAYAGSIALACREAASTEQFNDSRHIIFVLGKQRFALPLTTIKEVANPPSITRLPRTSDWLQGIVVLRGQIVSVTDLAMLFQIDTDRTSSGKLVVVRSQQHDATTALIVDRIHGIRTVTPESISPPPSGLAACTFVSGIASIEDVNVVLLDPHQLFASAELATYMN
ncbi:MAG: chemotaxis protein CheW [Pirellulaceae bacterium]|nr:chemotaxis protein CheW [Pirellulaceae bacterium]